MNRAFSMHNSTLHFCWTRFDFGSLLPPYVLTQKAISLILQYGILEKRVTRIQQHLIFSVTKYQMLVSILFKLMFLNPLEDFSPMLIQLSTLKKFTAIRETRWMPDISRSQPLARVRIPE